MLGAGGDDDDLEAGDVVAGAGLEEETGS
jgi:hypothetical protein